MKVSFAVACLISTSSAVQLKKNGPWTWDSSKTPWDKESLPDCPADDGRTIMDDGKTHVSKYPNVGATCRVQQSDASLVQFLDSSAAQLDQDPAAGAYSGKLNTLEHCPDFNERFTLADGKTKAVPYPEIHFNCNPDYSLAKKQSLAQDPNWGKDVNTLEHCPDFDERFTLKDGKTKAIPYPQIYYNCNAGYQLAQTQEKKKDPNWGPSVNTLEHCPDFDERFTLADGKTRAIPYPQIYYNCKADYQLTQKDLVKQDPNWGPNVNSLEHCPDFDERFTLADGKTKAIPYPQVYYNCKADYQLVQQGKKIGRDGTDIAGIGADIAGLEHCPDMDERFTLVDGKTRAIPYPTPGYNCNPEYAHSQKQKNSLAQARTGNMDIGSDIAGLEHCPDFDERFTLKDGKTRGIPYPQIHYNCNPEYALTQKKEGKAQPMFLKI